MNLFLIFLLFSSTSLFCGNTCSKGQVNKKEIEVEKKEIKESEPIKELPFLSSTEKINILRETIHNVIKSKGNLNSKFCLVPRFSQKLNRAYLLAFAVNYCDLQSVKFLLRNGANIDIRYFPYCGIHKIILSDKIFRPVVCYVDDSSTLKKMYHVFFIKKSSKELKVFLPPVIKNIVLKYL